VLGLIRVNKEKTNYKKAVLFSTMLLTVCSLNLFTVSFYFQQSLGEAISNIVMYSTVGILTVFIFPKISFYRFKSILTLFLIITFGVVTIPSLINVGDPSLYTFLEGRFRYLSVYNNSNELSRFALLGVLLSLRLWTLFRSRLSKVFLLFMLISNTYIIYLADSRASLLVATLAILLSIAIILFKRIPIQLLIVGLSFLGSICLIVFFVLFNTMGVNFSFDLYEFTSGRLLIWESMLSTDWKGLMFGTGPMIGYGSHNGYLELIKFFGLIGFIVWMVIIAYLLKKKVSASGKSNSDKFGVVVVLLFMLYHLAEGSMVSVGNLASIYFWLEISQRNTH
jgi:hypothetical protein